MNRWRTYLRLGLLALAWASEPCQHCHENPLCLGSCGYELLLKAGTPREKLKAQVVLGKAWVLGGFQEGAVKVLSEALREAPAEETALRAEARYWLAQAHQHFAPDSAQYHYKYLLEDPSTPPSWKAKAALALGKLVFEKNPTKAQAYASQALDAARAVGDPELQALALNQLAVLTADIQRALTYAEEALRLARSIPKPRLRAAILTNLATLYEDVGKGREALALYQEALQTAPDSLSQAHVLLNLSSFYYKQRQIARAEQALNQIAFMLSRLPYALRQQYYRLRFQMALERKALSEANRYFEAVLQEGTKAIQETEINRTAQLEQLSGLRLRESQLRELELSRQRERLFYALMGVLGVLTLGGVGYAYRTARRRAQEEAAFRSEIEKLNKSLESQARELERQNSELIRISEALAEAFQDLQDSISAAERLQKALMPPLNKIFSNSAVYYQPLQQVGGDFYIVAHDALTGRYLIAVGDATGHGVSGSILASIFGATIQNFFLQNPRQTAQALLMRVHAFASRLLATHDATGAPIREGCDIAMAIFDVGQGKVEVGLAGRPLWIWEPQAGLQELDGGRRGIDSFTPSDYEFPAYSHSLNDRQLFYFFTDGLTDVLNGEGRKWGIRRLRELVITLAQQGAPAARQMETILQTVHNWRSDAQPNDDITLLILPMESILKRAKSRSSALTA